MLKGACYVRKILTFFEHRGGDIIATILTFVIGYILARVLLSISQKAIVKSRLDPVCYKFLLSLLKVTLYSIVMILGCSRFVDTSSLIALLSVVGVAVSGGERQPFQCGGRLYRSVFKAL